MGICIENMVVVATELLTAIFVEEAAISWLEVDMAMTVLGVTDTQLLPFEARTLLFEPGAIVVKAFVEEAMSTP